jgi:hypothetical protein
MILSDRVSGRLPLWGFVAAAALALVTLPAWSVAQKPADNAEATAGTIASQPEQNARATAARLEQIEAALKRLSGELEEAKRSAVNPPYQTTASPPQDMNPGWLKLKALDKNPASVAFVGSSRNYFVRDITTKIENAHDHPVEQPELLSVVDRLRSLNTRSDHINLYERDQKLAQSDEELTQELFHSLLNRKPTRDELAHAIKHFAAATKTGNRGRAVEDIFWVIINSAEHKALQTPRPGSR